MKAILRVESLEALPKSATREKRIPRSRTALVSTRTAFDNDNESKPSDDSSTGIDKESQRLDAPPPNTARCLSLAGRDRRANWRPPFLLEENSRNGTLLYTKNQFS